MNKTKLLVLIVVTLLLVSVTASAMLLPRSEKGNDNKNDNAPIVPPGLEKVVFIHYKKDKNFASPFCLDDGVCEDWEKKNCADCKTGGGEGSACYAFLGKGVQWREPFSIDLRIHSYLDKNTIVKSANEWDDHTSTPLFGSFITDDNVSWDGWAGSTPDGNNELLFGDYPQTGVIAVAVTWGYFTGKPSSREIIEFDILFDTDFEWGDAAINPELMDLENIAVHEIGHGLGLADLYNAECVDETMYGYSGEGDIVKRDLNTGDIAGLQALYGE